MTGPAAYPRRDRHSQAAYWFVQLGKADCSAATRKAFAIWLQDDDANRTAYQSVEAAWRDGGVLEASTVLDAVRRDALINSVRRPPLWRLRSFQAAFTGVAASLALAAALFIPSMLPSDSPSHIAELGSSETAPFGAQDTRTIATTVGERNSIPLSDGSLMELNTSTTARVAFTETRREVVLLRGQAAFNVATEPDRPFVVLAGDRRITAIGTEFEVRVEDDDVAVTLLEGRVEVAQLRAPESGPGRVESVETVSLEPGQRLSVRDGLTEHVEADALERAMSWREGWLRFENDTLHDVIIEINRYSHRQFRLESPDLGELRVSGSFRAGSVESFASAVVEIYPVETYPDPDQAEALVIAWRGRSNG